MARKCRNRNRCLPPTRRPRARCLPPRAPRPGVRVAATDRAVGGATSRGLCHDATSMREGGRRMRTTAAPVEVVCVQCARPFTVSQRAYAQRTARYGSALRCPHCVGDRWLHVGRGPVPIDMPGQLVPIDMPGRPLSDSAGRTSCSRPTIEHHPLLRTTTATRPSV